MKNLKIQVQFFVLLGIVYFYLDNSNIHANAFESGYIHYPPTTYCWLSNNSPLSSKPDEKLVEQEGQASQCPLLLEMDIDTLEVEPNTYLDIRWKASLAFSEDQLIRIPSLKTALDPVSKKFYEVIHSNIHACVFGSGCDPFYEGQNALDPTPNQPVNFSIITKDETTAYTASFQSRDLIFQEEGIFSVVAHLILPYDASTGKNRIDFATYTKVIVKKNSFGKDNNLDKISKEDGNKNGKNNNKEKDGASSAIIIGFAVVGGILCMIAAIIFIRRQNFIKNQESSMNGRSLFTPFRPNYSPTNSSRFQGYKPSRNMHSSSSSTVSFMDTGVMGNDSNVYHITSPMSPMDSGSQDEAFYSESMTTSNPYVNNTSNIGQSSFVALNKRFTRPEIPQLTHEDAIDTDDEVEI